MQGSTKTVAVNGSRIDCYVISVNAVDKTRLFRIFLQKKKQMKICFLATQ